MADIAPPPPPIKGPFKAPNRTSIQQKQSILVTATAGLRNAALLSPAGI